MSAERQVRLADGVTSVAEESDFDGLRGDPEFARLTVGPSRLA